MAIKGMIREPPRWAKAVQKQSRKYLFWLKGANCNETLLLWVATNHCGNETFPPWVALNHCGNETSPPLVAPNHRGNKTFPPWVAKNHFKTVKHK